ncbi:hypothetical protein Moror_11900 [Moniliophthora roreri MCA 2997]|uniref:Uncharacterized protein n=2 Tax=Moniliophthora roreri TaxID=221103 RepID=V2WZX3_MONRO|nr:hypothetical protein Moror_11900 [Moniliophthora roreri MCA 2997]
MAAFNMYTTLKVKRAQTHSSFAGGLYVMFTHGNPKSPRYDWISNTVTPVPLAAPVAVDPTSLPAAASPPTSPRGALSPHIASPLCLPNTSNPQTPTRKGKNKEQPAPDKYDLWLEAEITKEKQEEQASLLRTSPALNCVLSRQAVMPSSPHASSSTSPHAQATTSVAYIVNFDGEGVVPRSAASQLSAAGVAFFENLSFHSEVVSQIGVLYVSSASYNEFVESMGRVYPDIAYGLLKHMYFLFETKI